MILTREIRNIITGEKEIRTREIDTHELAWAAGFFDGEGSSYFQLESEKHNPQLRLSLPQRDKRNLDRFNKAVLKLCNPSSRSDGVDFLKTHQFENTQAVIALLWKYLSPAKREQFKIATLRFQKHWKGHLLRGSGAYKNNITLRSSTANAVKNDVISIMAETGG